MSYAVNNFVYELYETSIKPALPPAIQPYVQSLTQMVEQGMANRDPRVVDWPFMNIGINIQLTLGYLLMIFVLVQIMKRVEKPFKLKWAAVLHNLFLTLLSLYMCVEIIRQAIRLNYNLLSQSIDRSENERPMAAALWVFYVSKVPEFFDTVLMALKKNFHQISVLHLYHHSSIFFIWWFIISYSAGGSAYFSAALNSFIHVLMYGYYLWATLSPSPKRDPSVPAPKPRWTQPAFYRRYITSMQMVQFIANFFQASYLIFVNPPPVFAMFTVWILFFYMISMLALFGNFYVQAYLSGSKKSAKVAAAKSE